MNRLLINECPDYKIEIQKEIKRSSVIGVLVILCIGMTSQLWIYSVLIGSFISYIYVLKAIRWNRFYIKGVIVDRDVVIKYCDKGIEKIVKGSTNSFRVNKKTSISIARIPYLSISNKTQNLNINQYEVMEWDESKMDALTHLLKN